MPRIDDVVEEFLSAASLSTGFIPSLARWIGREGATWLTKRNPRSLGLMKMITIVVMIIVIIMINMVGIVIIAIIVIVIIDIFSFFIVVIILVLLFLRVFIIVFIVMVMKMTVVIGCSTSCHKTIQHLSTAHHASTLKSKSETILKSANVLAMVPPNLTTKSEKPPSF